MSGDLLSEEEGRSWKAYRIHVLSVLETLERRSEENSNKISNIENSLTGLQQDLRDIKRQKQESGARAWQVVLAVVVAVLSLFVSIGMWAVKAG